MEPPDVPKALKLREALGLAIPTFKTPCFLSRETVVPTPGAGMAHWREKLFAGMSPCAGNVADSQRSARLNCQVLVGKFGSSM